MKTKVITKGKKQFKGRFYHEPDGTYVSVTSVIHPDGIDYPKELLDQYAKYGQIIHSQTEHYLNHYQWLPAEKVAKAEDLAVVLNGSLQLDLNACNPRGFFQEFGHLFQVSHIEQKVINRAHKYAGRLDLLMKHKDKLAVGDIKTARNYDQKKIDEYFMQQAAYAGCIKPRPEYMVILPFNPNSEKGYDEPIISGDVERYFKMFLEQLAYVREHYTI